MASPSERSRTEFLRQFPARKVDRSADKGGEVTLESHHIQQRQSTRFVEIGHDIDIVSGLASRDRSKQSDFNNTEVFQFSFMRAQDGDDGILI